MASTRADYVVVIGCGRLGSYMAEHYSRRGSGVVVVDADRSAFDALSPEYSGFTLEGDARELEVLERAKLDAADAVFVVTDSDNTNAMIGSVARNHFGRETVVVRIEDPRQEAVFTAMNLQVVCPTIMAAQSALDDMQKLEDRS